ncbi:MAG: formylglycine-generating enzyme family protein, partial [Prochlorotrichaceae cyanobacterium]
MTIGTEKAIVRQPQTELALPNQGTSLMSVASQQDWLAQLPEHEFETVQVDATGSIKQREQKRNKYFRQDLGAGVYLDLMHIPAGVFLMGSPEHEQDRRESEGPQHWVKVSEFFMGRYPITQAQWRAVSALPQINRKLPPDPSHFKGEQRPPDPSYFKGEQRPVERVSWYEAVEFCDRLSVYSQQTYRLPCEAEWEYACRAGTTTPFYFG